MPVTLDNGIYMPYNICMMERTTIFVDKDLLTRAKQQARKDGKSFAQVVREALAIYLTEEETMTDHLPSIAGQFASGCSDTSERVDSLLWTDPHQ